MRVVLDTNIFIAALLTPGSTNDALIQHWADGRYALLTSQAQLTELRRVTKEKVYDDLIRRADAGKLVNNVN